MVRCTGRCRCRCRARCRGRQQLLCPSAQRVEGPHVVCVQGSQAGHAGGHGPGVQVGAVALRQGLQRGVGWQGAQSELAAAAAGWLKKGFVRC